MTRVLDKDLLIEALEKSAKSDAEGWANQIGLDTEVFFETMAEFTMASLQQNPLFLMLLSEEQMIWVVSTYAAAFQFGWLARTLQKDEEY